MMKNDEDFKLLGGVCSLTTDGTMAQGGQKVQDVYFNISFDKTSSKSFKKPKYIIKMVVKTPLSSTDPIKEQEDRWSLDLENVHLQRGSLDKSCSKSFRQLKYIIKMYTQHDRISS